MAATTLLDELGGVVGRKEKLAICQEAVRLAMPEASNVSGRFNFEFVCEKRGIQLEYVDGTPFEGRLEWRFNRQAVITIRRSPHLTRVRFTLAHELGHWIVHELLGSRKMQLFRGLPLRVSELDQEECVADALAAELLMPKKQFDVNLGGQLTHSVVDDGLSTFDVSRSAFVRRFAELANVEVLQLTIIPRYFKELNSQAVVDDAWRASSKGRFDRIRNEVSLLGRPLFSSFPSLGEVRLPLEVGKDREIRRFDCRAKFALVPRMHLIGTK